MILELDVPQSRLDNHPGVHHVPGFVSAALLLSLLKHSHDKSILPWSPRLESGVELILLRSISRPGNTSTRATRGFSYLYASTPSDNGSDGAGWTPRKAA